MTAISAILFDKDGTLLDYAKSWGTINRQLALLAAEGDQAFADRLLAACGMDPETGHVVPDSILAAGSTVEISEGLIRAGSRLPLDELVAKIDVLFSQGADHAVPVTDLASLFARLKKRGLKLGIASSDNELSIRKTTERFGFAGDVDYIAGYDSGHGCKPEPGMVYGFAELTGIRPDRIAVVGDNNHDLHMARNAGAGLAIAVLTGTGSRQSLKDASDHVLSDITEIEALLDRIA